MATVLQAPAPSVRSSWGQYREFTKALDDAGGFFDRLRRTRCFVRIQAPGLGVQAAWGNISQFAFEARAQASETAGRRGIAHEIQSTVHEETGVGPSAEQS